MLTTVATLEAEAAKAAMGKVNDPGNLQGLNILDEDERNALDKYLKSVNEFTRDYRDDAARQLGTMAMINAALRSSGLGPKRPEDSKRYAIRATCPRFSSDAESAADFDLHIVSIANF